MANGPVVSVFPARSDAVKITWFVAPQGHEPPQMARWWFWPYFLFVFTVCFGAHAKGITNGPRTLALFLLLQIPALLLQSQPAPGEALPAPPLRRLHEVIPDS